MVAEQRDEDRLHHRDEERPAFEEDLAHPPEGQVERGVAGAQGEERADGPRVVQPGPGLNQDVAHHDAEPAQLDHDRLGRQLPARSFTRRRGHRCRVSARSSSRVCRANFYCAILMLWRQCPFSIHQITPR